MVAFTGPRSLDYIYLSSNNGAIPQCWQHIGDGGLYRALEAGQFSLQLSHQVSGCIYDIYMVIELKMIVVVVVVVVPLLLLLLLVLLQLLILLLVIVNIECGGACGSI